MPEKKKPATGIRAETDFVVGMGGKYYKGGAGSQATDIIMTHPEHGDFNTEMKAGPTVDHQQMRMDVDSVSGKLRQTVKSQQMSGDVASGKIHPHTNKMRRIIDIINRPFTSRGVQLKSGRQTIERPSTTKTDPETGKPLIKQEQRPASMQQLDQASTKKLSMNNKNGVNMMHMGNDHVHVAIHHRTGEVALIPTSNDHAHMGDKMGLSKTITYDHFAGDDHGHKNTLGLKLRGARAKGSTVNVSLETSSGNMVDAVRDADGHVFDSLDHATEHLRSHGWAAKSGHAMNENAQVTEGLWNPERGYAEIYRRMARGTTADKERKSLTNKLAAIGFASLGGDYEEEDDSGDNLGTVTPITNKPVTIKTKTGGIDKANVTFLDKIRKGLAAFSEDVDDDEDDESDTKPGEDQEVPYQTPEPGTKPVNSDAGGGAPFVKPVKKAMLGDDIEESIRTSFSEYLLKEKNIDTGVCGFMEPITDKSKKQREETAAMLIAYMSKNGMGCSRPKDK